MASVNNGWCVFGKVTGVTILVVLLLAGGASALSNSGGGSWQYYRDITISNSGFINDSSWTNTATLNLSGIMANDVNALVQGQDGTIFAATARTEGAVYRTTDGGASWSKSVLPYLWAGSLAIMPNGHIFATAANAHTWTDANLYKSVDGGINWTQTSEPAGFSGYPAYTPVLITTPDGTLYAGHKTHLYRTVNEGENWEEVYAFPNKISSLLRVSDGTLYVGTGDNPDTGGPGGYVYRGNISSGGNNWTVTGDLKDSEGTRSFWVKAMAEGMDGALYAGTNIFPYKGTLFRSVDKGNTWQQVTGVPRGINSNSVNSIVVTSDGTVYVALGETSGNLYRGRNVGTPQEDWKRVWGPADYGIVSLLEARDGRLYFGTSGVGAPGMPSGLGQARILKPGLNMPSNLTNYQVLVNLTSSNFPANAQTSGADIFFENATGRDLPFWIESWDYANKSSRIWVKVPSIPTNGSTTIRMLYGNPSATGSSNGTSTFQFFDDFNDGIINTSLWPTNVGDTSPCWYSPSCGTTDHIGATESGGVMSISHSYSNNYKLIKSNAIFNIPFRFGMKIKDSGGINDVYKSAGVGQPTSATYDNGGNNRVNLRRQWNGNFYDTMRDGSIEQNNLSTTMAANTWYTYLFSANPSQVDFYNETSRQIQTNNIPNTSTPLSVYVKTWTGDNSGSATISVDYIFLANYSYPEPSIRVGAEKATMPIPTNTIPIASFIYTKVGLTASFTSTSYDVDGTITEHNWDFGDGTFSKIQNPVHTYSINGNYQILLTVTDNNGSKSSKTETISISSVVISSVNHPLDISFGTGLLVKVKTNIETDITLNLDSIHQINKYGTDVAFYVNPAMLTKGSHTLKISAGGDSYNSSIIVYDPKIYLAITKGLDDLATTSKDEMREISGKTGYTLTNHVYSILLETEVGEDVTAGDVLNDLRNKLGEISEHVTQELEKYKNIVISIDSTIRVNELDSAMILITNIQNAIDESNKLISDENIVGSINEYVTKPAIYTVLSLNEANSIEARTYATKNNLNPSYTQAQLDEINEILSIGKEAIINTDEEQIYSLDIGTFFGREISAKPTLDYFAERQTESLNPPEDMCVFSKCFPGKYNPIWVYHLTVADAESILTIPAFIGWISATPEDERINARVMPIVAPVVMAVRAIKVYMKYVSFVESISPWVIDGGMIVSTNLLAQEVNEEHADIIQTISGITTGMGLSESINPPKLIGSNLYVPKGNILITTSPDGEIRSFKYVKSDSVSSVPKNRRVISINTGWSQTFNSLLKNISIAIASDKSSYNVSEMVNLTINISSDAYVEDALLWIFIPEANTTIKDMLNVTIGNMSKNYNFTIQNEIWHVPRVYLSNFGTILAENYTNFGVGSESREAGTITINYKEFYNPGTVNINITVHNTGNTLLDSRLIHFGSNQNLTGSIGIPTLQIRESTTVQLAFNLTIPEVYEMRFILNSSNNSKGMLDYNVVRFTVTAIDTLLAFPSTAKTIYNTSESVNVNVSIKNVTLNVLNFPYSLNTITPSGDIINLKSFTPEHNGTYIVKATPITEGYSVVEGETLFIVEEQSSLVIETNTSGNTTKIIVKTDLGGAVEGANVVVNGYALKTDKNGAVLFNSFNATQLIIKAEKFGFNPIAISAAILTTVPKTIYVSKNFTDNPANHEWNSIQEGVDDASPRDTVYVYNGMYYEHVNVTKSRLTLTGESSGKVKTSGIFFNEIDNNTLKGFTISPPEFFSSIEEISHTKLSPGTYSPPIENNYSLVLMSIDAKADPRQAWLILRKNGSIVDEKIVSEGWAYTYTSETGQTILDAPVEKIFAGTAYDYVILNHTSLIDNGTLLINDERIILVAGGDTPILYTTGGIDLPLYEGYTFTFGDLDEKAYPEQAWVRLSKNGVVMDEKVLKVGENYSFYKNGSLVFSAKIDDTFDSGSLKAIELNNILQYSEIDHSLLLNKQEQILGTGNGTPENEWKLYENFSLSVVGIDVQTYPAKIWLRLSKNGTVVDEEVVPLDKKYFYAKGGSPIIVIGGAKLVFKGLDNAFVRLTDVYQYSESGHNILLSDSHVYTSGNLKGIEWPLYQGYVLSIVDIDVYSYPWQVWLRLSKNGTVLDDQALFLNGNYIYNGTYGTILSAEVDAIFSGVNTGMVKLSNVSQYSDTTDAILMSNSSHQMVFGKSFESETWELYEGYALTPVDISTAAEPRNAWLRFSKNGSVVDERVVSQGENYTYYNSSGNLILSAKLDSVFAGMTVNMVQFRNVRQYSEINGTLLINLTNETDPTHKKTLTTGTALGIRGSSGIVLYNSNNNTLSDNTVSNYDRNMNIYSSGNNKIYHNNFIHKWRGYYYYTKSVYDGGLNNYWDSGYPTGGNYWSDYTGTDANSDGIGDTPYNISGGAGAQDKYPFMKLNWWLSAGALKGDVNGDNSINIVDALFVAQYTVGTRTLTSQQLAAADVNGDGQVTVVDALFIAQYTVGLRQL